MQALEHTPLPGAPFALIQSRCRFYTLVFDLSRVAAPGAEPFARRGGKGAGVEPVVLTHFGFSGRISRQSTR